MTDSQTDATFVRPRVLQVYTRFHDAHRLVTSWYSKLDEVSTERRNDATRHRMKTLKAYKFRLGMLCNFLLTASGAEESPIVPPPRLPRSLADRRDAVIEIVTPILEEEFWTTLRHQFTDQELVELRQLLIHVRAYTMLLGVLQ